MDAFSEGGKEILRCMSIQRRLAEEFRDSAWEQRVSDEPEKTILQMADAMSEVVSGLRRAMERKSWASVDLIISTIEDWVDMVRKKLG